MEYGVDWGSEIGLASMDVEIYYLGQRVGIYVLAVMVGQQHFHI